MSLFRWLIIGVVMISVGAQASSEERVILGLENLLNKHVDLIQDKNVGIIANHTSVDVEGNHIVDLVSNHANVKAVFGPEHGFQGDVDDGTEIEDQHRDELQIYSIYGNYRMPTRKMLEDLDILIYDIQDVGVKFYTFISNLFLSMKAAKRDGVRVIVLDRPNPITATRVEGAVTYPSNASFVGVAPLPIRYGMTVGELAKLFNQEAYLGFAIDCDLTVIPMSGYKRSMWYNETGLPWIKPSPNMPDLQTAMIYPGNCLFEGTNLSEGRGTYQPFLQVGAPFFQAEKWIEEIDEEYFRGVEVETTRFTPKSIPGMDTRPKHQDTKCQGLTFHITNPDEFKPIPMTVALLVEAQKKFASSISYRRYMDNLWGSENLRSMLNDEFDTPTILQTFNEDLERFKKVRKKYLIYD